MTNNCPYCDAEPAQDNPHSRWACGSTDIYTQRKNNQTDACRIRELEQRNAKLEAVAKGIITHYRTNTPGSFRAMMEAVDALD